jgi:hypothetical protein
MVINSLESDITVTKLALFPGRDRTKQRKTAQARNSGPDSTADSGNFDTSTSISRISATEYGEYPPLGQNKISCKVLNINYNDRVLIMF